MEINYNKLMRHEELTLLIASQILSTTGILKISSISGLEVSQNEAFSSLSSCLKSNKDNKNSLFETLMNDGTERLTIGAKSKSGIAEKIPNDCGKSSTIMRSIIDKTTQKLFQGLDYASSIEDVKSYSSAQTSLMKPYTAIDDLLTNGEHLEHLHVFYNTKNSTKSNYKTSSRIINNIDQIALKSDSVNVDEATLQMHTDVGLFIAMTTGYYSTSARSGDNVEVNKQRGLYVTLPTGEIVHVNEADLSANDLIIMIGQGGADWLAPKRGVSFRAVPHALVVDLGDDKEATRSWYGKMYLPPLDAELYNQPGVTFKEFQDKQLKTLQSSNKFTNALNGDRNRIVSVPVACGKSIHESGVNTLASSSTKVTSHESFGHPFHILAPQSCSPAAGGSGIMCWMSCASTSSLTCAAGKQPTCTNTNTGLEVDGMAHGDASYKPTCLDMPATTMAPTSTRPFCMGSGISMSMTGFESTVTQGANAMCYVYLIPTWVLDTSTKFGLACFGTVLIGIFIHGLSSLKLAIGVRNINVYLKIFSNFVIYFFQILASYIIMLVSMSFNVELFFMVITGLTIGYLIFNPQNRMLCSNQKNSNMTSVGLYSNHVEPCCQSFNDDVSPGSI